MSTSSNSTVADLGARYVSQVTFADGSYVELFGANVTPPVGAKFQRGSFIMYITKGAWSQKTWNDYPAGQDGSAILTLYDVDSPDGQSTRLESTGCVHASPFEITDTQPIKIAFATMDGSTQYIELLRTSSEATPASMQSKFLVRLILPAGTYAGAGTYSFALVTMGAKATGSEVPDARTIVISDQKPAVANGGSSVGNTTAITAQVRTLNTMAPLTSTWCTLNGPSALTPITPNSFVLAPGTYTITASAPAAGVTAHRILLCESITAATGTISGQVIACYGTNEYSASATAPNSSRLICTVKNTVSKTYQIRHMTANTAKNTGLGRGMYANSGPEVYTLVSIEKEFG